MIKNSVRQKEKLCRMRKEAKWLLSLVGEDWGIRVLPAGADALRPVHANVNKRFEAVIGSRRSGRQVAARKGMFDELLNVPWEEAAQEEAPARRTWLQRLSQRRIMRHFEGAPREFRIGGDTVVKPETYYFTGRRTRKGETCLTLLMLDVDAHKVGNLENAMEFARRLKDGFLPDCYVETSTNGKGAHVFLVVDKTDWADPDYNAVLRELDRWLKAVLAETGIELDTVEVKGSCATVSWKDGMPKHTAGLLAKLPREWERFAERLNEEGFVPPHRRSAFSVSTLFPLMQQLGLVGELYRDDLLGHNEWWIRDLATKLKVRVRRVHYWVAQGWVHSRRTPSGRHWIVWADYDELKRLAKLKLQCESYKARRDPKLLTPKARKG